MNTHATLDECPTLLDCRTGEETPRYLEATPEGDDGADALVFDCLTGQTLQRYVDTAPEGNVWYSDQYWLDLLTGEQEYLEAPRLVPCREHREPSGESYFDHSCPDCLDRNAV